MRLTALPLQETGALKEPGWKQITLRGHGLLNPLGIEPQQKGTPLWRKQYQGRGIGKYAWHTVGTQIVFESMKTGMEGHFVPILALTQSCVAQGPPSVLVSRLDVVGSMK